MAVRSKPLAMYYRYVAFEFALRRVEGRLGFGCSILLLLRSVTMLLGTAAQALFRRSTTNHQTALRP